MQRLACGALLATALVVTTAPGRSASEDAASRTVEIPGAGLALTLPVEWRIWLAEEAGQPTEIMATDLADVAAARTCNIALEAGFDAVRDPVEELEAHRRIEVIEVVDLTVPAGDGLRVSYRDKSAPDQPRNVRHDYYLTALDGVVGVHCHGIDPPADRWLSIVEAIAPLSADPPASAPFDPRVEVPDHGFAVDLGAAWYVRPWGTPGLLLGGVTVLRADTLTREDSPASSECWVEADTDALSPSEIRSPDDWREAFVEAAEARRQRTSEPPVTDTDLLTGDVVRADWKRFNGMPATAWVVSDGDRRVSLFCRSEDPPDDRWLSIVETIEFLPAER